jgi:hypothetical protein
MPDEISGMGKTNRNASLICKKKQYENECFDNEELLETIHNNYKA